jgi:hypothetical protein
MAAQAWFSSGDILVVPGTTSVLQLTVVNLADTTDTFTLTPVGMPAAWTVLRPPTLTLFGGTQQTVDVQVSPPAVPSTTAGPASLSVRVVPHHDPDTIADAETSLVIDEFFDRRVNVLQPALRSRRRAVYDLMLENRGNTPANCRLHLVDPSGRLEGEFDPPAAGVEPGSNTLVRLKVRAKRRHWRSPSRTVQFAVDADQPGTPIATGQATFVQSPMVPERLVGRLLWLATLAAVLAGAWFGVLRPEIRRAAEQAVADIQPVATTVVPAPGSTLPPDNTSVTPTTVPVGNETIVNIPLPVEVPPGQTGSSTYAVPSGKVLRITDIVVQNPLADQGTLQVSRDDKVLFSYNLTTMFSDVDQPLVTPLEFAGGEEFVVTVTCTVQGDLTTSACAPRVLASGVLVDA